MVVFGLAGSIAFPETPAAPVAGCPGRTSLFLFPEVEMVFQGKGLFWSIKTRNTLLLLFLLNAKSLPERSLFINRGPNALES